MRTRAVLLVIAGVVMWRMKRYYADAAVDDLQWILGPTARLVTVLAGTSFEWAPAEGYLSRERFFLIEKACAGINFMIAAFGMAAWVLAGRVGSRLSIAGVLLTSALTAYSAAIVVNATRITVALWLGARSSSLGWMTAAQAHRVEGVVCYFGGLVLLHELVRRVGGRPVTVRERG